MDEADRAHALALLLLPYARDLIDGPTPNHLAESPEPGSGHQRRDLSLSPYSTGTWVIRFRTGRGRLLRRLPFCG